MPHQPLTAVLAAAEVTGSHPGAAFYVQWILVAGAVIGAPVFIRRWIRDRRKDR